MKVSSWFVYLALFVALFVGSATQDVGRTLPESTVPWYLPIEVAALMLTPAWFAYEAGKEEQV